MRYSRPMLEDGRITYEFYHDPGKAMVHPSLDRLAFLIEAEGVRVHRLTDGAYERSGLAPDNITDEPQNRRGPSPLPLKPKAWNRLSVEIKGDKVDARAQWPADLRADPRADQPARLRALPLRRCHPGPRAQRDPPGRMAPVGAGQSGQMTHKNR